MSEQPEALRMADQLDRGWAYKDECSEIAAELRRLHELTLEQQGKIYALEMARSMEQKTAKLKQDALRAELKEATEAINDPAVNNLRTLAESIRMLSNQRDALLEALKEIVAATDSDEWNPVSTVKARAAIKLAEEGK